jgi:hypothetical protein
MPAPPCGNYGDVSGDGNVNGMDAFMVSRYLLGLTTLTADQLIRANVKGYGSVSQTDVDLINEYDMGQITTFPVCGATETRTVSLTEGQHDIQISLDGYNTLVAKINVPRVSTSGWTVSTYLKTGDVSTARCTWVATKDTAKVVFISEMVLAYNDLLNIGFAPTAAEIGNAVLMYSNLGTPASLWGC